MLEFGILERTNLHLSKKVLQRFVFYLFLINLERIKEAFDFPDYYGENWHAFRDAFITVGIPEKIVIHGEQALPKSLSEQIGQLHDKLDEIKAEVNGYGWAFEYEIAEE